MFAKLLLKLKNHVIHSDISYFMRSLKHHFLNIFRPPIFENSILKDSLAGQKYTILANGMSLEKQRYLERKNVFIFNHFWRHRHYPSIVSGFHLVSDFRFCEAIDIERFISTANENLVLITTDAILYKLRELGFNGVCLKINYSGSNPVWKVGNPLNSDLTLNLQTGSTVVSDICFPFIKFTGIAKIDVYGLDLDYGLDGKNYAFDVTHSKTESPFYLKNLWKIHAKTSTTRWIEKIKESSSVVIHK